VHDGESLCYFDAFNKNHKVHHDPATWCYMIKDGKARWELKERNALRTYIEQIDKKVAQIPKLLEERDRLREAQHASARYINDLVTERDAAFADIARLREANDTLVAENRTLQPVLETENEDNIALRKERDQLLYERDWLMQKVRLARDDNEVDP